MRTYGAVGDGQTSDTAAIQKAIDATAATGGGTICLQAGRYVSGTLLLRSGITLRIGPGATLLGSTAPDDYRNLAGVGKPLPHSPYGQDEASFSGLIIALDQHDVAVTGPGTIDGRGVTVAAAIHQMQVDGRLPGDPAARPDEALRPCLINFVRCQNVRGSDVTLRDSACWVENYTDCDELAIDHVTVRSPTYWNNDGLDITGCRHVRVADCDIDSADDGICLKSNATACEDVDVRDCVVRSRANGLKLGTVSFAGFRHISIKNIQVTGAGHSGLAIECVDGGAIDDVTVSDVTMKNLKQAILIKLGSRHAPGGVVGSIRNVVLSDITAETADGDDDAGANQGPEKRTPTYRNNRYPCIVSGLPGHPIEHLTVRRVACVTAARGAPTLPDFPVERLADIPENPKAYPEYPMHGQLPAFGWFVRHAAGVTLQDLRIDCRPPDNRAALVFDDASDVDVSNLNVANPGGEGPVVALSHARGVTIHGCTATMAAGAFVRVLEACDGIVESQNVRGPGNAGSLRGAGSP